MRPTRKPEARKWIIRLQGGEDYDSHHWAEWFFIYLNRAGLTRRDSAGRLATLRGKIGGELLSHAERGGSWYPGDSAWRGLLGLDEVTIGQWSGRHRDIVQENSDLIRRWVKVAGRDARNLESLCRWLVGDAARDIRLEALVWIDEVVTRGHPSRLTVYLQKALVALLAEIWKQPTTLRQHERGFHAFRTILGRLVGEQVPAAMLLSKKIENQREHGSSDMVD